MLGVTGSGPSLLIMVGFIGTLKATGLTTLDSFTSTPDAVVGQKIFNAKFDQGTGMPAVIIVNEAKADQVIAAARQVEGVPNGDGAVCLQPDYAKLAQLAKQDPGRLSELGSGCLPGDLTVQPRSGRTVINAQLVDSYDTPRAGQTVLRLRAALHPIPGAEAQVGGQAASTRTHSWRRRGTAT